MKRYRIKQALSLMAILSSPIQSLTARPIDFNGKFISEGVYIKNARRTHTNVNPVTGSHVETGEFIRPAIDQQQSASFQNYVLSLSPSILINDSASLFGELTTAYARTGFFGDSSVQRAEDTEASGLSFGNSLYTHNTIGHKESTQLSLPQLYAVLYSDTATWYIGRHTQHWGLGAIFNDGRELYDRHKTIQDGVTAKFKIGNFQIDPFWAKINSLGEHTRTTNTKHYGFSLLYSNFQSELKMGLHFSKKKSDSGNSYYKGVEYVDASGNVTQARSSLQSVDVKITDFFFQKSFDDFTFAIEVPLLRGDLGNVYGDGKNTKYKATAIITETNYNINDFWKVGLNYGNVSGEKGASGPFEAAYLHPNYQVGNLMFHYNLRAISNTTLGLYDASLTNVQYIKLYADYQAEKWNWNMAILWAQANETASPGSFYQHDTNQIQTSTASQDKNMGIEVDINSTYQWNENVNVHMALGYHAVGKYYEFTGGTPVAKKNTYMGQVGVSLLF